jgi:hypothetical protein
MPAAGTARPRDSSDCLPRSGSGRPRLRLWQRDRERAGFPCSLSHVMETSPHAVDQTDSRTPPGRGIHGEESMHLEVEHSYRWLMRASWQDDVRVKANATLSDVAGRQRVTVMRSFHERGRDSAGRRHRIACLLSQECMRSGWHMTRRPEVRNALPLVSTTSPARRAETRSRACSNGL